MAQSCTPLRALSMTRWNKGAAPLRPKGIIMNWYRPDRMAKTVFGLSEECKGICQYTFIKSRVDNIWALPPPPPHPIRYVADSGHGIGFEWSNLIEAPEVIAVLVESMAPSIGGGLAMGSRAGCHLVCGSSGSFHGRGEGQGLPLLQRIRGGPRHTHTRWLTVESHGN